LACDKVHLNLAAKILLPEVFWEGETPGIWGNKDVY
jgi:hypothetical protein